METGTLKQILLITDGCSNQGEDPIAMASLAREHGITVNVIGVVDRDTIDPKATREIEGIATAGGGVHQIVYKQSLSQTVQMVTRQAMTQTIQGVVNKELQQILGNQSTLEELPPDKRGEVMDVVDELGEKSDLALLVLVDTSASMTSKLPTVKESLIDLSISLNSRLGNNQFSIALFPGKRNQVENVLSWTTKLESLSAIFSKIKMAGITPTGPAIKEAIQYMQTYQSSRKNLLMHEDEFYDESNM
ncbi:VWA domain-containing protein [Bacillus carboniphilus]